MGNLYTKRILVTGAATGIGRSTAIRVAAEGARVAAFDVNDAEAGSTLKTIERAGGTARYWHVDVSSEADVSTAVEEAAVWLGHGVDVLIHLAGMLTGAHVDVTEVTEEDWNLVIDVNLKGSFLVVKHVATHMKRQKSGVIILTSSSGGVLGASSSYAYGSSKGGVHGFAMTLDAQLSKLGIRVNEVMPGSIDTPLKVAATEESYRSTGDEEAYRRTLAVLASPDGVASVIAFLASDDASYVRGSIRTI